MTLLNQVHLVYVFVQLLLCAGHTLGRSVCADVLRELTPLIISAGHAFHLHKALICEVSGLVATMIHTASIWSLQLDDTDAMLGLMQRFVKLHPSECVPRATLTLLQTSPLEHCD